MGLLMQWAIQSQYKLTTAVYFRWTCTGMPDEQREGLQEELIDIILRVLKRNLQLHYYQGYHDIVVTFLLVVKERHATALVEKLSTHHLRYLAYTSIYLSIYTYIHTLIYISYFTIQRNFSVFLCLLFSFSGTSWILPWTTQNTFLTI